MNVMEVPRFVEPDRKYWRHRGNRQVRKARWSRELRRWSLLVAVNLAGLAVFVFVAAGAIRHVTNTRGLSVREIEVLGVRRTAPEGLRESLGTYRGANLASLDLESISARVDLDPWVLRSSVKRVFPDTLRVEVVERSPAALAVIDGTARTIDTTGAVIGPTGPDLADDLPVLTGLAAMGPDEFTPALERGVRALERIREVDPGWADRVSELDLSRSDRIAVTTVGNGPTVLLDPERPDRNLENYLALRAAIRRNLGSAEYADLRWSDRIAVMPLDEHVKLGSD